MAAAQETIGEIIPSERTRVGRILSGGHLTATITSKKSGQHISLDFVCKVKTNGTPTWKQVVWREATFVFINTVGGDRVATYFPDSGKLSPARGADPKRVWAAKHVLLVAGDLMSYEHTETGIGSMNYSEQVDTPLFELTAASICGKCGRELTDPISIQRGLGPHCYGASTASEHQVKERQPREAAPAPQVQVSAPKVSSPAPGTDRQGRTVPKTFEELAAIVG